MKMTFKVGGRQRTFNTEASATTNKRKLIELAAIVAVPVVIAGIVSAMTRNN